MTKRQYDSAITHLRWAVKIKNESITDCQKIGCTVCNFFADGGCVFSTLIKVIGNSDRRQAVAVHP